MELLYALIDFLTRTLIATALLFVAIIRTSTNAYLSQWYIALPLASTISFVAMFTYGSLIYPYFLDPLRKYPTVDISGDAAKELLPITINPRGKQALQWVKDHPGADIIHIRIFPGNRVILPVSPAAHRDVLGAKAEDFIKPVAGQNFLSEILGYGLILSEGETHKLHRKFISPSFRIQNIKALQPLIAEKTALMLEEIQKEMKTKGKIEIASWASRATMDIIGPALMSKDFQSLTTQNSALEHAYAELIAPSQGAVDLFELSFILPKALLQMVPSPINKQNTRNVKLIRSVCTKILDEKLSTLKTTTKAYDEEEATSDILGSIMSTGGAQWTQPQLVDQMMTFLGAGHETTASSIAWVTHLLTLPQYTHYQSLLRTEIRTAMQQNPPTSPADGILSYTTLESLPLLNGICEETLRLYPPVTNTGRKALRPTTIAGIPIPAGTIVTLFPWAINRNPEFWGPDAEILRPERWIDTLPDGTTQRPNKHGGAPSNMCLQTFLHGNRSCIGRDFARAELRYMVAAIFGGFEMGRLPGDDGTVVPAGSLTIKPEGGLYVTVTPVE